MQKAVEERRKCRSDPELFLGKYIKIIDPRFRPAKIIPFKPWPHQQRLMAELIKYQDTFIEKSRDMGISWLVMGFELHQVLFSEGFNGLNISRRESEVQDPGLTYNSLMGRLDFMYNSMPDFLKLKIQNPFLTFKVIATNSVIKGESANINAGRDTQYSFIFVDEAAHIQTEIFRQMWKGLRNSSNAICLNSTPPEGDDNKYVELKNMADSGFKHLSFHWREHPNKDEAWFKKKEMSMTPDEIEQELNIGYNTGESSKSYPEFERSKFLLKHKIYYNPKSPLYLSFDFGLAGEAIAFYQISNLSKPVEFRKLYLLKCYEEKNLLTYEHVKNIRKILKEFRFSGKLSDLICYGDIAGTKRSRTTKTSVIQEYQKYGINIKTKQMYFEDKVRIVKKFLKDRVGPDAKFVVNKDETDFCLAMEKVRLNKKKTDHIDNWATHKVNQFEYIVVNLFPVSKGAAIIISVDDNQEKIKNLKGNRNLVSYENNRYTRRSLIWH